MDSTRRAVLTGLPNIKPLVYETAKDGYLVGIKHARAEAIAAAEGLVASLKNEAAVATLNGHTELAAYYKAARAAWEEFKNG